MRIHEWLTSRLIHQDILDSKGRQGDHTEEEEAYVETEVMHDGSGNGKH
jgi:hypothetical protein